MIRHRLHSGEPEPGDGVYGLACRKADSLVHLIPVPFEATVSYRAGTARGPAAILEASRQVDLFDGDFGRPYRAGIYLHRQDPAIVREGREARKRALPVIERLGNVGGSRRLQVARDRVNAAGATLNRWLEARVDALLDEGRIAGVLGGDHSVPFGSIRAHARRHPGMGILHLDAHADLRRAYEGFAWSHASIMHNVFMLVPEVGSIVQVGIRDYCEEEQSLIDESRGRIRTYFDARIRERLARGSTWSDLVEEIVGDLPREVYLSFDIDGLDPALCPHTGTPVPGGLDFHQVCTLLLALVRSGRRIVGFDLVEVAPGPPGDEWDGNVGARLLYKMIGAAVSSRVTALAPGP